MTFTFASLGRLLSTVCVASCVLLQGCASDPASPTIETRNPADSGGVAQDHASPTNDSNPGVAETGDEGPVSPPEASTEDALRDASTVVPSDAPPEPNPRDAADSATDAPRGDASTLPARVLLYHFSTSDIPTVPMQLVFYKKTLGDWGYEVEDSVDPTKFTDANLVRYAAVAMINTCFEPFGAGKPDRPQSEALQRFVQKGGGLFGTHCAAVTFQSANPPALYNQVFGGRGGNGFFDGMSNCRKTADHPTTSHLPATFVFNGNLDNADFVAADSVVLVKCTWSTGKEVSVSWYRTDGLGRVFYTNFGKVQPDLDDATLGAGHIVPGLAWVLGR